jgi:hypothetical protein
MKVLHKEYDEYIINYITNKLNIFGSDITYISYGNSLNENVFVFICYKNPNDRRKKEMISIKLDVTYNEFVRNFKIESILS